MKMKYTPRQCDLHRVQNKVFVRLFDTNILVLCSFLCFILRVTKINNDCKNHDETIEKILKIVLLLDSKLSFNVTASGGPIFLIYTPYHLDTLQHGPKKFAGGCI